MSELARLGCEVCGERHGCCCDLLVECDRCGADFLPSGKGDAEGFNGLCEECQEAIFDEDDVDDDEGRTP